MRTKKRLAAVVDTNVAITANYKNGQPLTCVAACALALNEITKTGVLVIDEGGLIFGEYKNHLSFSGGPGAGDSFFKWLTDNRYNNDRVARVALAEDPRRPGEFAAFPDDVDLKAFDKADRKFVAVALTHPEKPPVLNAIDSDWWNHRDALRKHDVQIRFVCGAALFRRDE